MAAPPRPRAGRRSTGVESPANGKIRSALPGSLGGAGRRIHEIFVITGRLFYGSGLHFYVVGFWTTGELESAHAYSHPCISARSISVRKSGCSVCFSRLVFRYRPFGLVDYGDPRHRGPLVRAFRPPIGIARRRSRGGAGAVDPLAMPRRDYLPRAARRRQPFAMFRTDRIRSAEMNSRFFTPIKLKTERKGLQMLSRGHR